jgi:hypothetical protein
MESECSLLCSVAITLCVASQRVFVVVVVVVVTSCSTQSGKFWILSYVSVVPKTEYSLTQSITDSDNLSKFRWKIF